MAANSREILIPKLVKNRIEEAFIKRYRSTEAAQLTSDKEILEKLNKSYLEVDVFVKAESEQTLSADTVFQSARGGGRIDLDSIIVRNKGSLYFSFAVHDPDAKLKNIDDYELYFWSTYPPKQIEENKFGLKCGTILKLDISQLNHDNEKDFQINVTDSRHRPVVNGTYYFARYEAARLALAIVQIGDGPERSTCIGASETNF